MAGASFRTRSRGEPGQALTHVIAIILAAGRGERFGMPKVLVPWDADGVQRPLGLAHLQARVGDCARAVLVVRGSHLAGLAGHALPAPAEVLVSSEPDEDGPAGSLFAALSWVAPSPDVWLLVTPVDVPPASHVVVDTLVRAVNRASFAAAARPSDGARRGHPVLVRASLLLAAFGLRRPPLRSVLQAAGAAVLDVPVDDPTVFVDFNRPSDLAAHLAAHPPVRSYAPRT